MGVLATTLLAAVLLCGAQAIPVREARELEGLLGDSVEVTHKDFVEGGDEISEDLVTLPGQRKVIVSARNKNPAHSGVIHAVFDFDKNVIGFSIPKIQRCYVLAGLAQNGVSGEVDSGESGSQASYGRQTVVLEPDASHTTAEVSELPTELQDECRDWPVFRLHRQTVQGSGSSSSSSSSSSEEEVEEALGGEQPETLPAERELKERQKRHHHKRRHSHGSRSRHSHSHGSRSRHSHSRGRHGHNRGGYGGYSRSSENSGWTFNVGGCVAIASSNVCVKETTNVYNRRGGCDGWSC